MKEALRERALALGFDACRFTTAAAPVSAGHFERWIQSGQSGEMAYLARNAHKRIDPQQVLPGAKSVICVALNYGSGTGLSSEVRSLEPDESFPGVVARYARHADYHDLMGERLRELSRILDETSGGTSRSLWYVDTGPILEREFAQRAGLGFVGKHTHVISRRFGNWILLGEILTSREFAPDPPEKNHCGSCTRCLTACPTRAITTPFHLDARLCISYLTIELKGPIPEPLRPAIGNRIFGCDDCLQVCPWNRFAAEAQVMQPLRRDDLRAPDLPSLLALDNTAFKQRFRGTPLERGKRRGLLRNVCVALGNCGDARSLALLEKAALDVEPLIAEHARWAIGQITARLPPGG